MSFLNSLKSFALGTALAISPGCASTPKQRTEFKEPAPVREVVEIHDALRDACIAALDQSIIKVRTAHAAALMASTQPRPSWHMFNAIWEDSRRAILLSTDLCSVLEQPIKAGSSIHKRQMYLNHVNQAANDEIDLLLRQK